MILSVSKTPLRVRSLLITQFPVQTKTNAEAASRSVPSIVPSLWFSTKSNDKKMTLESYNEEKIQAKEYRTKLYNKRKQRRESLQNRRSASIEDISEIEGAEATYGDGKEKLKRGIKKAQFRNWFDPKRNGDMYYNRQAKRQNQKWKVKVGLLIERLPVVTADIEKWEEDFDFLSAQLERERAIIYPKEIQGLDNPMDCEVLTKEELLDKLPEGFRPAPRITEDDKNNNIRTRNRKLSERVYLSIRPDNDIGWSLPIATLNEDIAKNETLVDCVKRYMKSNKMLKDIKLLYLSNSPVAADVTTYDNDERSEGGLYFGEKVFYMKVQYEEGDVNVDSKDSSKLDDWGWLARSEMVDKVKAEKGEDASLFYHYLL